MPQRRGVRPYSVHTTFQYGAVAGKRHRLREAELWEDSPEYYDPPEGLLRFEPHVPDALVHPTGGMNASGHVSLVNHQLAQLGAAFALAFALRRKLILPRLVCGYDKAWFALDEPGVFAGSPRWELPIRNCPLDHVLEPLQLQPEQTVREYSFLENLRVPVPVLTSQEAVTIDASQPYGVELDRMKATQTQTQTQKPDPKTSPPSFTQALHP